MSDTRTTVTATGSCRIDTNYVSETYTSIDTSLDSTQAQAVDVVVNSTNTTSLVVSRLNEAIKAASTQAQAQAQVQVQVQAHTRVRSYKTHANAKLAHTVFIQAHRTNIHKCLFILGSHRSCIVKPATFGIQCRVNVACLCTWNICLFKQVINVCVCA